MNSNFFNIFLISVVASLLYGQFSCHYDPNATAYIPEEKIVKGKLSFDADLESIRSDLQYSYISAEGTAIPFSPDQFESSDGNFRIKIPQKGYLDSSSLSEADRLLAPTGIIPLDKTQKTLYEKYEKLVRIQVMQKLALDQVKQERAYGQKTILLNKFELLADAQQLKELISLDLKRFGFVEVQAIDGSKKAISDVTILGIVLSSQEGGESWWTKDPFRPVLSKSNSDGKTIVGPIPLDDPGKTFRIYAWKEGYCAQVSESMSFNDLKEAPFQLLLRTCEATTNPFKVSFLEDQLTYQETVDGILVPVAYTRQDSITIRLDATGGTPIGYELSLHEGIGPDRREDALYTKRMESFTSKVTIPLPSDFSGEDPAHGAMSIKISPLKSDGQIDGSLVYFLSVRKKTSPPNFTFMEELKITTKENQTEVLSGLKQDEQLMISVAACDSGTQIGIQSDASDLILKPCIDNFITVKRSEIKFKADEEKLGGKTDLKLFFKDRFGNLSLADQPEKITKSIYLDYGRPQVKKPFFVLGETAGFYYSDGIPGSATDDSPLIFTKVNSENSNPLVIERANLSELRFSFSNPQACISNGGLDGDGTSSEPSALKVQRFKLVSQGQSSEISATTVCELDQVAVSRTIAESDIKFPEVTTDDAIFALEFTDLSGNISASTSFLIPPCLATHGDGTHICWQ